MWSFVLLDLDNKFNLADILGYIKLNYENPDIIYCSTQKVDNNEVRNYVFDKTANNESVINTIVKKCNYNNIVIIRDIKNYKQITELTNKAKRYNNVVYFKKQVSGFKGYIKKKLLNICNFLFKQNIKLIDYSIVAYGETASLALKNTPNPSVVAKTNNWTGINYVELTKDDEEYYKFKYNKKTSLLLTFTPLFISVFLIVLIIIAKFKMLTSLMILYFAAVILGFFFSGIFGLAWFIKSEIGDSITEKAKYI